MNVLLIQTDQWPWFCLGHLGNPDVRTPHLDSLISEGGTLFANTTVQSPICLPSRVSMLSGCYVGTTGQPGFSGYCRRGLPWMPRHFQTHGYFTGAFGKFHAASIGLDDWGFDIAMPSLPEDEDFARPHGAHYRAYCEKNAVPWPTDQMHGHDPHGGINLGNGRLSRRAAEKLTDMERWSAESDVPLEHSLEPWTSNRCLEFLETASTGDKPFFAWVSYDRPHYPTTLPPEWYQKTRADTIHLDSPPDAEMLQGLPLSLFDVFNSDKGISRLRIGEKRFRELLATYHTLIEWIDAEIGRLLEHLERLGLRDKTIIAFTTDHGDEAGRHGLFDKDLRCYSEAVTRIPMIIHDPRNRGSAGHTYHDSVENIDLFPTLSSLCGLPCPDSAEGHDLASRLQPSSKPTDDTRPVFCEDHWQIMVKKSGYRLTFDCDDNAACTLHDLNQDPGQTRNLISGTSHSHTRISLKKDLLTFLCHRLFGNYTDFDIERILEGLSDEGRFLPLLNASNVKGVRLCYYRAALAITDTTSSATILVPFYPGENILYWSKSTIPLHNQYLSRSRSSEGDPAVMETLLDAALRQLMTKLPAVSIHAPDRPRKLAKPDRTQIEQ